jgi:para-nitrobenzyl esterase
MGMLQAADGAPIAQTAQGNVRGAVLSEGGRTLKVFKGISYAAAPVGPLRWRPPQPGYSWSSVRDVLQFGPDFPQAVVANRPASGAPSQGEDCLYLNLWAPADVSPCDAANGGLPVMVWVHGGGFERGSGADYASDGAALAAQGVVVVSFNYRCGLFGFMAHPALSQESAHGVSGNYGLLDQIAAFNWVKHNIAAFGGDANRVTAFGVSAGSASIALLLTSPLGKGLFQQAILHSPGAARPLASLADAEQLAVAQLGSDIDALRDLSAQALLAKTSLMSPKVRGLTTPRVLRPIRDGWLLPEDERPVLKAGRMHVMPLIVGSNADEGSMLTKTWPVDTLQQYREMVRTNFGDATGVVTEVMSVYPVATDSDARLRVGEMFADTQFNYGTWLLADAMAKQEPRTWRYLFLRRRPHQRDGPHHGEEVSHVFGTYAQLNPGQPADFDAGDERVSDAMMKAWVAFASHANPNAPGLAQWSPYAAAQDNHLVFGDTVEEGQGWRREQLAFLDRFYDSRK